MVEILWALGYLVMMGITIGMFFNLNDDEENKSSLFLLALLWPVVLPLMLGSSIVIWIREKYGE